MSEVNKSRVANLFIMRYFSLLLVVVFVLIVAIGYFFVIQPKKESVKKNIETLNSQKQEEKDSLVKTIENFSAYIDSYNQLDSGLLGQISLMLPDESDEDKLFLQMEYLFKKNGFFLRNLSVAKQAPKALNSRQKSREEESGQAVNQGVPGVGEIILEVQLDALSYEEFKKLLALLEDNLRIMDVVDINFVEGAEDVIDLKIKTYYLESNA